MKIRKQHLVIIDPLAEDKGHLIQDDAFLTRMFADGFEKVTLMSSPKSISNVCSFKLPNVATEHTKFCFFQRGLLYRLQLAMRLLTVKIPPDASAILVQSFEELSLYLFMLVNRKWQLSVIVTNNLANIATKPTKKLFLKKIFCRAHAVFIHCDYEKALIADFSPSVRISKVHRVRFHHIGTKREQRAFGDRKKRLVFMGMYRQDKGLSQFWRLVQIDAFPGFTYGLFGQYDPTSYNSETLPHRKLEMTAGFIPETDYYKLIAESMFIILPYTREYEGKLSGVFCDAIASLTPVIVPRIEPFREFFCRYGQLGFMVDFDDNEWILGVGRLDEPLRYAHFQQNMKKAIADNSMKNIFKDFASGLS